jgi:peroxiredoxin
MLKLSFRLLPLLLTGFFVPLFAKDLPPATESPSPVKLDKKVEEILSSCAKFYNGLQGFTVDIISETEMVTTGMKQQMDATYSAALSRPNSFALRLTSGFLGGTLISDGKTCITYEPVLKKYTSTDAPDNLDDLFQPMNLVMILGGMPLGLESFLAANPIQALEERLTKSGDAGFETIGGAKAHHVQLSNTPYVTDFWIADGPSPLLLQSRVTLNMKESLRQLTAEQRKKLPPGTADMSMVRTTVFNNWKVNPSIEASAFQFQPPPDAQLVPEFVTPPPHPLTGKSAPDFELNDLDGKPVKLSALRGKIVVLDFWATWCGPCVASLPMELPIAASFKDKGVLFYGVNMMEKADTIRQFQQAKSLPFPVLLDTKGDVAHLYAATSIPQLVLIDKDGKIQAVHVGYQANIKKVLTRQLNDMLAGKDLAVPGGK